MDAARYNRIRELFLAAEEMAPGQQEAFLQIQTAGDVELLTEVVSLLAEHDPQAAQDEGECAQPVNVPGVPISPADLTSSSTRLKKRSARQQKSILAWRHQKLVNPLVRVLQTGRD